MHHDIYTGSPGLSVTTIGVGYGSRYGGWVKEFKSHTRALLKNIKLLKRTKSLYLLAVAKRNIIIIIIMFVYLKQ